MNLPKDKTPNYDISQEMKKHSPRRILLPLLLTVLFIIVYTFILQKNFSDETLRSGLERNTNISDTTSTLLANEFTREDFIDFTSTDDMEKPRYQELQSHMNYLRRVKGIRYLYTAGRGADGAPIYLVDGLDLGADDFAFPGTYIEEEMVPYINAALSGKTVYSQDIVDTTWGHIYTACYPVTANDGSGDIIGALCIEVDMESIYASIDAGNKTVSVLIVITLILVVMLSVLAHFYFKRQREKELAQNIALQDSFRKLQEREVMLEALSIDFDSVYLCDLVADTTQIIKEDSKNYDPYAYSLLGDKVECYSFRMQTYFDNFVEQDSAPDLPQKLSAGYLTEYLKTHSHMTCRFRVKPNPTGHVFMETKIVPVKSDEDFMIVMGFHYIDDIVEEQERQKAQLEKALYDAQQGNEIISAIARIYEMIYYIDLKGGTFERIADIADHKNDMPQQHGFSAALLQSTLDKFVAPEWHEEMGVFLDTTTLTERLKNIDSITSEYQDTTGRWYRARFIIKNRDEQHNAVGVLFVAREITFEKKQELDLKQRLKESAEEADRANASKTDFLRRMSHDVRTPINGIRGMVEIANYYPNDMQKQKECRDKIWDSTSHLLSLVNNILDMNKLESGRITLRNDPFDLRQIISETNSISEMQAIEHNVKFSMDTAHDNIVHNRLIGSATHLKQIILNFTSNAIKYNHEGGSVTVSCREISNDNKTAIFQFICDDTGIGMSEEFQKHAFEPFVQEAKDSVRTNYAGSGLGLSIAKQLIELMGGTIELHSRDGIGTSIRFTLPFDIDPDPHLTQNDNELTGFRLDGIKALLAEDNDLNAEIAKFLLEKYGMDVTWAPDGKQAIDIFSASKPGEFKVIFMDVMMPVMNGLEAARGIRSLDRPDAKTVPIFAMTANAFIDDIQRSLDAGMNEHLTKPLQESDIISALQKYLKQDSTELIIE